MKYSLEQFKAVREIFAWRVKNGNNLMTSGFRSFDDSVALDAIEEVIKLLNGNNRGDLSRRNEVVKN